MSELKIYYSPRNWQKKVDEELKRFHTLVVHRRAGKTVYAAYKLISTALSCEHNRPQVAYIGPTYKQAKKVAWEIIKDMLRDLIREGMAVVNEAELRIDFPNINRGRIMVLGAENPDSLRGLYLDYAVLDEVADMPRELWTKVIRPTLSDRKGKALFIGTPKAKDFFYEMYSEGLKSDPEWGCHLMTYEDTQVLDPDEIKSAKKAMQEEEFEQEYLCSFDAGIKGAYFAKNIARLYRDKRAGGFPPDVDLPVITAWDIGFDGTAIWFCQLVMNEIRVIDFLQVEDMDIPEVIQQVKNKPYVYDYHILPHDSAKRSAQDKSMTMKKSIEKFGFKCIKARRTSNLLDDINNSRRFLDKVFINLYNCEEGIDLLSRYRPKKDKASGLALSTPIHDASSHAADAFRTLAAGLSKKHAYPDERRSAKQSFYKEARASTPTEIIQSQWDVFNYDR